MAKWVNDVVLDTMLDEIAESNTLLVCSSQPADRTAALAAALADVAITPGAGLGDFTISNGDTSGRKLTIAQQDNFEVDTSGTATHVALIDGTRLLYVTTCVSQALVDGNNVTTPAWDIEVADPS